MRNSVLIIEPVGACGGMEHLNDMLCKSLTQNGVEVFLATSKGLPSTEYDVFHFFDGVFGAGSPILRAHKFIFAFMRSLHVAIKFRVRVIHFQIFHIGILQCIMVALLSPFSFRIVVSAHDVGSFREGESSFLLKWFYSQVDHLIVHSDAAEARVKKLGLFELSCISKVPLGSYEGSVKQKLAKRDACAGLKINPSKFTILFFGQVKKIKRLDLLVESVAAVNLTGQNIQVLCAGVSLESGSENYLAAMENKLQDAFIRHDYFIADEDIPLYMSAADIAVLPYDDIMQSGVLLLLMSYEVPVVVSNISGMTAIVEHGFNGLVFQKGDANDLSRLLKEVISGHWDLNRLASAGSEFIKETYDWNEIGEKTATIYEGVVNES